MDVCFVPAGELGDRLSRNLERLETARYEPDAVGGDEEPGLFREAAYAWPGDFEGRTLLAWTVLERSTGRTARYLSRGLVLLPSRFNAAGYLGPMMESGTQDEQQLAGHGWLLRALSETWLRTGDAATYTLIDRMVVELALPTRGAHETYPIEPAERRRPSGSFVGERAERLGNWVLSTDIGCDFIFLDGLAQAATILGRDEIDGLVEEIIERFLAVDLVRIQAQTHATLTGIRALLRWAEHKGRQELRAAAVERFQLFLQEGASENHANWNWFARPTHTEPCAVVDAFMIACQLWQHSREPRWLQEAQLIFYNGLGHAQRAQGGFGCDSVLGGDAENPGLIRIAADEAWWCCSMRGAEGLATAHDYAVRKDGDELIFPFLFSGRLEVSDGRGDTETWECRTAYPRTGSFELHRLSGDRGPVHLAFFLPDWASCPTVTVDGVHHQATTLGPDRFLRVSLVVGPAATVTFSFAMEPRWVAPRNDHTDPQLRLACRGPLQYGWESAPHGWESAPPAMLEIGQLDWDPDQHRLTLDDQLLTPINDMLGRSDLTGYGRQFLFAPPTG